LENGWAYLKFIGRWCSYYRVIDTFGAILDFMLSTNRDEEAATRCFKQSIANNGKSEKVVIYKSCANNAGLMNLHTLLFFFGDTFYQSITSEVFK
jgi:transposase-like protein